MPSYFLSTLLDDYDQYQDDIRLIKETRFALWDNNPALLNAEYELGPCE